MDTSQDNDLRLDFLARLKEAVGDDPDGSASMYDLGAEMGLERDAARRLAESLIAEELIEIKTLAGAVALTEAGLTAAGTLAAPPSNRPGAAVDLAPVLGLSEAELASIGPAGVVVRPLAPEEVERLWALIPQLAGVELDGRAAAELTADLAGLAAQLTSPRPKAGLVRECLLSIRLALEEGGGPEALKAETDEVLRRLLSSRP